VRVMPTARSPNPARRSERARLAILKATLDLTLRHGFTELTIDAIAARAGVGKQTIYRWWPSKGAVAAEAIMQATLPRVRLQDTGDFVADVRTQLRSMVQLMGDARFGPRIAELMGAALLDRSLAKWMIERVVVPLREKNRQHIARATQRGLVHAADEDVLADVLFGPLWFRLLVSGASLDIAYADAVLDVVLSGVGRDRDRPPARRARGGPRTR